MELDDMVVSNPVELLKIVGILDIQGFYLNEAFVPRQLAIVTADTITKVIDFDTNLVFDDLSDYDQVTVNYLQMFVHHLDLAPPNLGQLVYPSADAAEVLRMIELDYRITEDRPIGVNNEHVELMLRDLKIPHVKIREVIKNLPRKEKLIKLYSKGVSGFSTSAKVDALWRTVQNNQKLVANRPTPVSQDSNDDNSTLITSAIGPF
jgi:hypothetical protein